MDSEATYPPHSGGSGDKLMRIHDQNPAGPNAANNSTTGASHGANASRSVSGLERGTGGVAGARQPAGPDSVSLSNLAASLGPDGPDREAELDRLSELYQKGLYEPDPGVVAEGLLDEGLAADPDIELPGENRPQG